MEKLRSYQGLSGQFSEWKGNVKAKYDNWKEDHAGESLVDNIAKTPNENENDYSHIYRSEMQFQRESHLLMNLSCDIVFIALAVTQFRSIFENRYI